MTGVLTEVLSRWPLAEPLNVTVLCLVATVTGGPAPRPNRVPFACGSRAELFRVVARCMKSLSVRRVDLTTSVKITSDRPS